MKIAVNGSRRQEPFLGYIAQFLTNLGSIGATVVMHRHLFNYLLPLLPAEMAVVSRVTDRSDFDADFAVSIGGDGSFLRTAAWVADRMIPIVGVNTGHLGYLSALSVDRLPQLPDMLARPGCFEVQERSMIAVEGLPADVWPYALNEVAFIKAETASMITCRVDVDGLPLTDYRSDGLLVATPTGSTAYNLSVGGPIVQPQAPVIVVSPIAAHSLSMRPLVLSDGVGLRVTVEARARHFRVALDGRSTVMPAGSSVSLARAPFVTRLMMLRDHSFAATLRDKLMWGVDQ